MDYIKLTIPVEDTAQAEILIAELSDFPVEGFQQQENILECYMSEDQYLLCKDSILSFFNGIARECRAEKIPATNWNQQWESDFEPVDVQGECLIHAPFHNIEGDYRYRVEISPRMSFGTGHHDTTWLMVARMLSEDMQGKKVLDMGSGTGVLAILAAKMGAATADAVDIDRWAYDNCVENIDTNGVGTQVVPILGDKSVIPASDYHVVLANINRNILLADMPTYSAVTRPAGTLHVSGILQNDIQGVIDCAQSHGFIHLDQQVRGDWGQISFIKE